MIADQSSVNATVPAWVPSIKVVYIGKAGGLRRCLNTYRRHGAGQQVGHCGGRLRLTTSRQGPAADTTLRSCGCRRRLIAEFVTSYGGVRSPIAELDFRPRSVDSERLEVTASSAIATRAVWPAGRRVRRIVLT